MKKRPIYLDYMATTPVDPRVQAHMMQYLGIEGIFGNPASKTHCYGQEAAVAVGLAREKIAEGLHAVPEEIIFTSGATESNNLAIFGAARFYQRKGRHLVTLHTEHKSVLDSFRQLEREGFEVTYLYPQRDGLLDLMVLADSLREDTILVSVMHANNEIGVIQDLAEIGALLKNRGIIFHVDAAQSAGKLPINLRELSVDLMSFSGHKMYAPKGIGALYVRQKPRIRLQPLIFGGGHEGGLRSGTLATHQIAAFGEAWRLMLLEQQQEQARLLGLREKLWAGIKQLPGIQLNGHGQRRLAGNLNFSIRGIANHELLIALSELAVSTTSACSSGMSHTSHVLDALGLSRELAQNTIRLSIGRYTTEQDIECAIAAICREVLRLKNE